VIHIPHLGDEMKLETVTPSLIVMSEDTAREIMGADYSNQTGILIQWDNATPRTVYGVRVAYDNTLRLGEFIVAEILK